MDSKHSGKSNETSQTPRATLFASLPNNRILRHRESRKILIQMTLLQVHACKIGIICCIVLYRWERSSRSWAIQLHLPDVSIATILVHGFYGYLDQVGANYSPCSLFFFSIIDLVQRIRRGRERNYLYLVHVKTRSLRLTRIAATVSTPILQLDLHTIQQAHLILPKY